MTWRTFRTLLAAAGLGAAGIGIFLGASAIAKTYQLRLSGDEGATFSGSCTVAGLKADDGVLTLEGQVPYHQEIVGDGLACQLEATGRVVVEIEHDGGRTRSATSGGRVKVRLR